MFPIFRSLLGTAARLPYIRSSSMHLLTKANFRSPTLIGNDLLLTPASRAVVPVCGFKVKGVLRKRCKDCYFVRREDRLYVICKTHPRHKQMQMQKAERNTWILSHATQGKIRPW